MEVDESGTATHLLKNITEDKEESGTDKKFAFQDLTIDEPPKLNFPKTGPPTATGSAGREGKPRAQPEIQVGIPSIFLNI